MQLQRPVHNKNNNYKVNNKIEFVGINNIFGITFRTIPYPEDSQSESILLKPLKCQRTYWSVCRINRMIVIIIHGVNGPIYGWKYIGKAVVNCMVQLKILLTSKNVVVVMHTQNVVKGDPELKYFRHYCVKLYRNHFIATSALCT